VQWAHDIGSQLKMKVNETCQAICDAHAPAEDAKFINERIREDYNMNWLVDGLPAAEMKQDENTGDLFYDMGYALCPIYRQEIDSANFNISTFCHPVGLTSVHQLDISTTITTLSFNTIQDQTVNIGSSGFSYGHRVKREKVNTVQRP
jgi:hypothetical protein